MATGLMLIGVGKGTKALTELTKLDKEYVAEIRFGMSTTTGDSTGETLEEKKVEDSLTHLQNNVVMALTEITGEVTLPVSAYSAIKIDGVAMYKRAHKAEKAGEQVTEVPLRTMNILEASMLASWMEAPYFVAEVRFKVGSGTYIRSLAVELGKKLGYPATLQNLRRTKIATYTVETAQQVADTFVY
jgi:tRNA pseudouridine55 synthase